MSLIVVHRIVSISIMICFLVVGTQSAHANNIFTNEPTARKPIDVVVGLSRPPFVIEKDDKGYEIELITAVLNTMDYQPKLYTSPLGAL